MELIQKPRVGVLGSGKGSNLVALANASAAGQACFDVALVLSDVSDAGILTRAQELGIPELSSLSREGPNQTRRSGRAAFCRCVA